MSEVLSSVEYRDVPGFLGYRVGSDGSMWSRRGKRWKTLQREWHKITPKADPRGRMRIQLYRNVLTVRASGRIRSKQKTKFVHRLVLEAFVGPCPPGMVACHRNDDASDNRLENLRWDTHKGNAADAVRNGRYRIGPAHHAVRATESLVKAIRRADRIGVSCGLLARLTGLTESTIRNILKGHTWKWLK